LRPAAGSKASLLKRISTSSLKLAVIAPQRLVDAVAVRGEQKHAFMEGLMTSDIIQPANDVICGTEAPFVGIDIARRKTPRPKQKILVIEDDKSMHTLYKAILEDPKYTFISAYDGAAGLAIAEAVEPDLILLDVGLPDITGFFICKYLKMHPLTASIPVIFVSGLSSAEDMVCGLEAEASDYVTKPFEENDLRDRVEVALRAKRTMDQIATAFPMLRSHTRALRPATLPPYFGNVQQQLLEAQTNNPWTRIGRIVDELTQRLNKSRKHLS
jgi:DNA-binding response OmpR family regulator